MPGTASRPLCGPGAVRAQRQLGHPIELSAPVAQLVLGGRRSEPRFLPLHEMPVLNRKLRQPGWLSFQFRVVSGLKLLPEHALRPSVGRKVMNPDHQRMIMLLEPQELGPQRRIACNIQALAQQFARLPLNRLRSLRPGAPPHVELVEPRRDRADDLQWSARTVDVCRSQHLMALADRRKARLHGVDIKRSEQTRHFEDVVIVPDRIEPAQEMDPLLLKRQADAAAVRWRIAQAQRYCRGTGSG